MKKVTKIQREWIGWILWSQRDWVSNYLEVSSQGMILLQKAYLNEVYDEGRIASLLNYVLEEFNKDTGLVKKWKERHGA